MLWNIGDRMDLKFRILFFILHIFYFLPSNFFSTFYLLLKPGLLLRLLQIFLGKYNTIFFYKFLIKYQ